MQFTVYTRHGCAMCDRLVAELRFLCRDRDVGIDLVDIDADPGLTARYSERVPVLAVDGKEICEFRLDPERISQLLDAA